MNPNKYKKQKLLFYYKIDIDKIDYIKNIRSSLLKKSLLKASYLHNDIQTVRFLLELGADVNSRGLYNTTSLSYAAERGNIEIVELLLQWKADINSQDSLGQTPLILASMYNKTDVVKLLLNHYPDVNITTTGNWNALMCASRNGNLTIVKYLLNAGSKIRIHYSFSLRDTCVNNNKRSYYEKSALKCASFVWNIYIIIILLEFGSNINEQDKNGDTILMKAVKDNQIDVVKLLLYKGANTNIQNKNAKKASDFIKNDILHDIFDTYKKEENIRRKHKKNNNKTITKQ
jgi:ankyrin repeat protein